MLVDLADRSSLVTITQDDPTFPAAADWVVHDADLSLSWHNDIVTVPTLLRVENGEATEALPGRLIR